MEKPQPAFHEMFAQLGLPCDACSIAHFVQTHSPLPGDVDWPDADFWSPAQAGFLRESLLQDNGWAQQVYALSEALRGS